MAQMAGFSDDPQGFSHALSDVNVLEGGNLTSDNVAGCSYHPLQCSVIKTGAVPLPGGNTTSKDVLHSADVG